MSDTRNPEILKKVQDYLKTAGEGGQTRLANELGYNTSSGINQYLKGTYPSIKPLEAKLAEYFAVSENAADLMMQPDYVPTSISEAVYQTIRNCHLKGGLAIECGDAGIGKTKAAQISKQAQIITNIESLSGFGELELCIEEQSEYEKLIEKCNENKRSLYERFIRKEIDEVQFKSLKSDIDIELKRLTHAYTAILSQAAKMKLNNEEQIKLKEIAEVISKETRLSRTLIDLLIDKVFVYPDNQVEILWKMTEFSDRHKR